MPRVYKATNPASLVHQALERSGGLTAVAKELKLSTRVVSEWEKADRIPGAHVLRVCHLADIDPLSLITYIERRKKPWFYKNPDKKPNALDSLVAHQKGNLTEAEVMLATGLTPRVIRQTLTLWGDRLELLRDTLHSDMPAAVKAARLNVTERQLRRLSAAYLPAKPKVEKPYMQRRKLAQSKWRRYRSQAVRIIRGETTVVAAAEEAGLSARQMHRWLAKSLTERFGMGLQEIKPLPKPFRFALAAEVEFEHPEVAIHLIKYWKQHNLVRKPMPDPVQTWTRTPLKRCLIGLFLGEITLNDLAAQRQTDKARLIPLLTGNLAPLQVSYDQAATWSVAHQETVAEILNSL